MNGDVRLRVEGLMLERLLERAIQEGARFRAVEPQEDHVMTIDADPHSAAIVQALCERFSMPCTVVARRGRDAMARRLRERATALAGVVVCLMALSAFFGRVWIVDVELTGERDASVAPIEQALSEMGVQPGVAKSEVDADRIESALAASSPDFSFVGVRLQGVRLLVEVAPAVAAPEVYQVDAGRDLVAACDGVVLSVNVETGVACVEPGDTVVRGQVLIRGEERVSSEETRGVAALGSVVARTWTTATASAPLTRTYTERTGRSATSSELCLMGFSRKPRSRYCPSAGCFCRWRSAGRRSTRRRRAKRRPTRRRSVRRSRRWRLQWPRKRRAAALRREAGLPIHGLKLRATGTHCAPAPYAKAISTSR